MCCHHCSTICTVVWPLVRASGCIIHRDAFPSNTITVAALTSDLCTARQLLAAPREVIYSQGENTWHWHKYHRKIQSVARITWFSLSISVPALHPGWQELINSSKAAWAGGIGNLSGYNNTKMLKQDLLLMKQAYCSRVFGGRKMCKVHPVKGDGSGLRANDIVCAVARSQFETLELVHTDF